MSRRLLSPWRLYALCLLALALPLAGCGGGGAGRPQYPVHGKVVSRGKPAAGAIVVFHPLNPADATRFPPRGKTDKDGVFVVGSRLSNDGACAGDYDVTLIWPEEQDAKNPGENTPPDRLEKRYDNVKRAKWRVHVKAGDNALEPLVVEERPAEK